jgi:hypothetical protein
MNVTPHRRTPRWTHARKLRILAESGLTPDEIASANERITGWRPTPSAVRLRLAALEIERRQPAETNLTPWRIAQPHNRSRFRHMLQAESRRRRGVPSQKDDVLISLLYDLLFGRGAFLIVGYHRVIGFYLAERETTDTDIVRQPAPALEYATQ